MASAVPQAMARALRQGSAGLEDGFAGVGVNVLKDALAAAGLAVVRPERFPGGDGV
jgi:hypothetical protein